MNFSGFASSDLGQTISVVDIVAGNHSNMLDDLVAIHRESFVYHHFETDRIMRAAMEPSKRGDLITHQWLVLIDNQPAAYTLFDTNFRRGIAPMHFLAVRPALRSVTVSGIRLATWIVQQAASQALHEYGDGFLGLCAETPTITLDLFLTMGWARFEIEYLEPIHGSRWRDLGLDTRSVELIWFPSSPEAQTIPRDEFDRIAQIASAAFLIDTYELSISEPFVIELTGTQRLVEGPRRGNSGISQR